MELTRTLIEAEAREYERTEPFAAVERTSLDSFPAAFREGAFTWRDAQWVVRWYYRRRLGDVSHTTRRDAEDAFRDNDFDRVREAVAAAVEADDVAARVRALTALTGVDVPVASAFLQFVFPETHLAVGAREWGVLREAGRLDRPYPDEVAVADYETYLTAARNVADETGVDLWTLARALWERSAAE